MILKTISVTYGRKMNLGDFNSLHVEASLWADLEQGDDEAIAAEALRTMARNQVGTELARMEPKLAAKITDLFMGLPKQVRMTLEEEEEYEEQNKGAY